MTITWLGAEEDGDCASTHEARTTTQTAATKRFGRRIPAAEPYVADRFIRDIDILPSQSCYSPPPLPRDCCNCCACCMCACSSGAAPCSADLSSAFFAFGIRVLLAASMTAWW